MSWWDLLDIVQEARDIKRAMPELEKQACPVDGEPLITGPHGALFCRFCGYQHIASVSGGTADRPGRMGP